MGTKTVQVFGTWSSSVTPRFIAGGKRLQDAKWDPGADRLYWLEGRSDRSGLVSCAPEDMDVPRDLCHDFSIAGKVGYGGGEFAVHNGWIYAASAQDGRIYRFGDGVHPVPVTPAFGSAASPEPSSDGRWLAYVHHDDQRRDRIAVTDAEGCTWPQILAEGRDFYTQVRWSPDGARLAFVAWDHPAMPWDSSSLWVGRVDYSGSHPRLTDVRMAAGGNEIQIMQPEFSPDGRSLYFVSDETGFPRLHVLDIASGCHRVLTDGEEGEFGVPNWMQDRRQYVVCPDGRTVIATVNKRGFTRMYAVDVEGGEMRHLEGLSHYTDMQQLSLSRDGRWLSFTGSAYNLSSRLVAYDLIQGRERVVARTGPDLPEGELSQPLAVTWKTAGHEDCHGLFYPPRNDRFVGSGKPPLLVMIHGGPTSQTRAGFNSQAQFFTSRGYACLFVNYRGSTGYGRAYMLKLRGRWGVSDVEDAVSGARWLAETGKVDRDRMVIMGGSAGGYTVLQTMVREPEFFAAGISLYGIGNQFALAADTHKFEEHYNDSLLGPLPAASALYRERSPLFHASRIKKPLALFQGGRDKVVPRDQAEQIVAQLRRNGTPHVYHLYEDEGHGFRKYETLDHFYRSVEQFLKDHVIYA